MHAAMGLSKRPSVALLQMRCVAYKEVSGES